MKKVILLLFIFPLALMMGSCEKTRNEPDPAGTVGLEMLNYAYGSTYLELREGDGFVMLNIGTNNKFNIVGYSDHVDFGDNLLCDIGSVGGLGGIKSIPTAGWTNVVEVVPGNGYVIRFASDKGVSYARLFVVGWLKSSTSIAGAYVKYQVPFVP